MKNQDPSGPEAPHHLWVTEVPSHLRAKRQRGNIPEHVWISEVRLEREQAAPVRISFRIWFVHQEMKADVESELHPLINLDENDAPFHTNPVKPVRTDGSPVCCHTWAAVALASSAVTPLTCRQVTIDG